MIIISGSLFFVGTNIFSKEKTTITWARFDLPPIWIGTGKFADQGIVDYQRKIYERELTNFNHKWIIVNPRRLIELVKDKTQLYCNDGYLFPPGGNQDLIWSEAPTIVTPNHLIVRKELVKKLPIKNGKISLDEVLQLKKFLLSYSPGLPYGGTVNKVLAKHQSNKFLQPVAQKDQFAALRLLSAKRTDLVLGYPFMLTYVKDFLGLKGEFVPVLMEENSDYYPYYVVCNKHPDGQKAIEEINKVIRKYRKTKEYDRGTERWYPESTLKEYHLRNKY